jgi:phospholipid/cholesterol/gamma-HCH transport system substrate-binding protein
MEMMAVDPVRRVVLPRFLGCVISMPLLAAVFSLIGLFGAQLIGVQLMGVDAGQFWSQMRRGPRDDAHRRDLVGARAAARLHAHRGHAVRSLAMRQTRAIELGTGLFVLLGFAALFFLVTQITNRQFGLGDDGYRLVASFEQVGGLKPGAPVSMSGVTIGRVEAIDYDFSEYRARVTMRVDRGFDRIPDDSDAGILTAGLLGGQYVGIGPGSSETFLADGDQIQFTQSAIVLENLISKFLFSKASEQPPAAPQEEPAP